MMRSLYAGVTGLRNHQTRLDVIGSNIANVNTVGFKKSRVTFRDALYQNLRGASSPQANRGGTNPQQIGLGMNLSTVDVIQDGSSSQSTGKTTDLCIQGNGFFVISDGSRNYFTRAGNFDFDTQGNYVSMSNGFKVMGYLADANGALNLDNLVPISTLNYKTLAPKATAEVNLSGNLDATLPVYDVLDPTTFTGQKIIPKSVYDSLGYEHTLTLTLTKTGVGAWDIGWEIDNGDGTTETGGPDAFTFDSTGKLDVAGGSINEINITTTGINAATGANEMGITVDFSVLSQYDSENTAWAESQDGYQQGDLDNYTIDVTGTIMGKYSNGLTQNIGQVATSSFQNPGGLLEVGETMFAQSNNSGDAQIGQPGLSGRGSIIPGSLEMSNVDLSQEFTDMIVTQRGFQANSRIITTSDEMLQELVNLKR